MPPRSKRSLLVLLSLFLGSLSFGLAAAAHPGMDWDVWAKLAIGAHVWHFGHLPHHDAFAFTRTLPDYVDHEWGSGAVFFGLLSLLGPGSLVILKLTLALGTLLISMVSARRAACGWPVLLVLAIPAGGCLLPAFSPVIRSHTFSFFLFALTLLCLERAEADCRRTDIGPVRRYWAAAAIPAIMVVWTNLHGGFVAGLGAIAVYAGCAFVQRLRHPEGRDTSTPLLGAALGALLATLVTPYGAAFWSHLMPALLARRPLILEWMPLPPTGHDIFVPFRLLFYLLLIAIALGWRTTPRSWPRLLLLIITMYLGWSSRRHTGFLGITSLVCAGPYVQGAALRLSRRLTARIRSVEPLAWGLVLQVVLAGYAGVAWLPRASLQPAVHQGHEPVREVDILSRAGVAGNLAIPFHWGSYAAWHLYPKIRISCDGRYEAAFPEFTFLRNTDLFWRFGAHWDNLLREQRVDYIILDLGRQPLRPRDLQPYGFTLVWQLDGVSALMARSDLAGALQTAHAPPSPAPQLPDAAVPTRWWADGK